jgi:hypothetical protein
MPTELKLVAVFFFPTPNGPAGNPHRLGQFSHIERDVIGKTLLLHISKNEGKRPWCETWQKGGFSEQTGMRCFVGPFREQTGQIRRKNAAAGSRLQSFGHARLNLYSVRQPDDEEHLLSPEQLRKFSYRPAIPGRLDGVTDHPWSIP